MTIGNSTPFVGTSPPRNSAPLAPIAPPPPIAPRPMGPKPAAAGDDGLPGAELREAARGELGPLPWDADPTPPADRQGGKPKPKPFPKPDKPTGKTSGPGKSGTHDPDGPRHAGTGSSVTGTPRTRLR